MTLKNGPGKIIIMAIKEFFKKPATISYPKGKMQIAGNYRGRLEYEPSGCIGCKLCVRSCPAGAIEIINEGSKEEKKMKAVLNVGHCIFCCQCVDSCPKKCLTYSQNIDLSSLDKKDFLVQL